MSSVGDRHAERELPSRWHVAHPLRQTWEALADPVGWQDWWPGLRMRSVRGGDVDGVGARVSASLFAGHTVRFGLEVREVRAPTSDEGSALARLASVGDLRGVATTRLSSVPDGTVIDIDWRVRVDGGALLRAGDRWAWPVLRYTHEVAMDRAERGLARHLADYARALPGPPPESAAARDHAAG